MAMTHLLRATAAALVVTACGGHAHAPAPIGEGGPHARGAVEHVTDLGVMRQPALQAIASEFPGAITVANDVELYRIDYWTELKGQPTLASGLLVEPLLAGPSSGVVMFLHGTNIERALAPSQPGRVDGNEEAAVFGGNHYTVVLPDYIGLGVSTVPQAYVVAKPQVDASLDLLRAAETVTHERELPWASSLFLMGFSQGGQSVAALHRELERAPLPALTLRGSVAIAAPCDLALVLRSKLTAVDPMNVGFVAFALYAYAIYYDHPLGTVFAADYARTFPTLLDGNHTLEDVVPALPDDTRKLFAPGLDPTQPSWLATALDDNETFRWIPKAPIRLYFGSADHIVPPAAGQALFDYASPRGGHVTMVDVGPVDHAESAQLAYAPTLAWFGELAAAR